MNPSFLIDAAELASSPETPLVLDTRKPESYARGHIPGAVNLSTYECFVKSTRPADLAEFRSAMAAFYGAAGAERERPIVVYEDGTGMRAARELWILEYLGHPNARMLHGGLKAWLACGGRRTTVIPVLPAADFEPMPREHMVIAAEELLEQALLGSVTPLDVRDATEFAGTDTTACCTRRGHIPRAVWLEWTELLDAATGKFKAAEAIRQLLAARGVNAGAELAPYCHRGARSANTYYALRYAGFASVRNYIGSFHEWSARSELPIE
ncbi:MAG: sulfurtransferase [Betaproteobacteria bacterium]|nr:sulfurtransferase [Betaproteobacteria bacterium]